MYTVILKFNQWLNSWRARVGLPYWSLSQYLKLKVKSAVSYISSLEKALAAEAKKRGFDGVICGHIHKPEMRDIDGILYCNDGDCVESLSALVEDHAGVLRLVTWQEIMMAHDRLQLNSKKRQKCLRDNDIARSFFLKREPARPNNQWRVRDILALIN